MMGGNLLFSLYLVLLFGFGVKAQTPVLVTTQYGDVEGNQTALSGHIITRFLGIPYAKPPVGNLRFMTPEEPEPWSETLTVKDYQNSCIQWGAQLDPSILGPDEDCLYLNIYVPEGSNLPVMVWIHGGSLFTGTANLFNSETLSIVGQVIIVTINYRLDVFGFFSSGDDVAEGNAAFHDQLLALKWVKNNIAAFGGDVERVTIFGGSAGGQSVAAHVLSPLSQGYFQRAICQSGSLDGTQMQSIEQRRDSSIRLAEAFDCPTANSAEMVACLQAIPTALLHARTLLPNVAYFENAGLILTHGDSFLPKHPDDLIEEDHIDAIDLMMGVNSDEGLLYFMAGMLAAPPEAKRDTVEEYLTYGVDLDDPLLNAGIEYAIDIQRIPDHISRAEVEAILIDKYFQDFRDPLQNMRGMLDMIGHVIFNGPTMRKLHNLSGAGHRLYLYFLDQVLPMTHSEDHTGLRFFFPTMNPELPLGVPHAMDVFYMFGFVSENIDPRNNFYDRVTEHEREVGRSMVRAWTEFAKTGVPTYLTGDGAKLPWPQYDPTNQHYLEFKYPMDQNSTKSRLLPSSSSFHTNLLPAYMDSYKKTEECPETGGGNGIIVSTYAIMTGLVIGTVTRKL